MTDDVNRTSPSEENDSELSSHLKDEELFRRLLSWYRQDVAVADKWRKHAIEDFNFYSGAQWDEKVVKELKEQSRPVMTFNRIAPLVNAVIGSERNNKRKVQFIPRKSGIAEPCDVLTGAAEWFRQVAFAEYADSEAFKNAVISGMGWTDTKLDFTNNPDGDPLVINLDPLKMVWDCMAEKINLSDARRLWYVDRRTLDEAKFLFPNIDEEDLHASWYQDGILSYDSSVHILK